MTPMKNYYAVLGVHPQTSNTDLRLAHAQRAKRTHPDKVHGKEDAFMLVSKAYTTLRNRDRHIEYRKLLAIVHTACAKCGGSGTRANSTNWTVQALAPCAKCGGSGYIGLSETTD